MHSATPLQVQGGKRQWDGQKGPLGSTSDGD